MTRIAPVRIVSKTNNKSQLDFILGPRTCQGTGYITMVQHDAEQGNTVNATIKEQNELAQKTWRNVFGEDGQRSR